jgi:cellulose synthase/poly-beta-1,6-N-acetylglucosamine synthase-like glycosyltransferase
MAPLVSVIVPCRNEARFIGGCLESILSNDYPPQLLDVVVVDGMSEDGTPDIVLSYTRKLTCVRLLTNRAKTTPAAMNLGIASARGSVIIIASSHSQFAPNFVSKSVAYLKRTGAEVVGGPLVTMPGTDTQVAKSIALATSHRFGVGNSRFRTSSQEGYVDTVPFGAYRREIFDRVGVFDERLERNQDNELCSRIIRSGGRIFMTRELTACYYGRATLGGLATQAFRNGMWNVLTIRITPAAFRWRHFTPFLFVSGFLALSLGSLVFPWCRPILFVAGFLYCLAALFAAIDIGLRSDITSALLVPAIFLVLHTAYGAGTWCGLMRLAFTQWGASPVLRVQPVYGKPPQAGR